MRKGILTIIPKDNINQNSTLTTATRHYHKISSSIFQLPTEENPGIAVKCEDLEQSSNRSSLKIDPLPSSSICLKYFLTALQTLTIPSKLPPIALPTTPNRNDRNRISDEVTWLKIAITTDV